MAVAEWKTGEIETLTQMISENPVVGIVNISNIPAREVIQALKINVILEISAGLILIV